MRNRYAGRPFTTPTAEIAAALEDVSVPTLLLSLVHLTGDTRYLEDFAQAGLFLNEIQGFMSEEDKARARAVALEVIVDHRDRGCPEPAPLSSAVVRQMMDWAACEPVGDEYLPLLSEELDLEGADPRRPEPVDPVAGDRTLLLQEFTRRDPHRQSVATPRIPLCGSGAGLERLHDNSGNGIEPACVA